ncbi:MAG: hypothetical protein ACOYN7_02090 [Candidatus Nanopelagicales bacterium]
MSPLQAILLFAGIPLTLAAFLAVAVSAGSWMRRTSSEEAELPGGALFISSATTAPDPSRVPDAIDMVSKSFVGGGASDRW